MTRRFVYEGGKGYTGFFLEFIEEWSQFFEACNWRTFHPIMFEIEDDRIMGGFEITLIVLGIGFRARWNHTETEDVQVIKQRVKDLGLDDDKCDDTSSK